MRKDKDFYICDFTTNEVLYEYKHKTNEEFFHPILNIQQKIDCRNTFHSFRINKQIESHIDKKEFN